MSLGKKLYLWTGCWWGRKPHLLDHTCPGWRFHQTKLERGGKDWVMIKVPQNLIVTFEFLWAFSNKCLFAVLPWQNPEMLNVLTFSSPVMPVSLGRKSQKSSHCLSGSGSVSVSLSQRFFSSSNHSPPCNCFDALGLPLMRKENLLQVLSSCL